MLCAGTVTDQENFRVEIDYTNPLRASFSVSERNISDDAHISKTRVANSNIVRHDSPR